MIQELRALFRFIVIPREVAESIIVKSVGYRFCDSAKLRAE